jgi:hypothetical protein
METRPPFSKLLLSRDHSGRVRYRYQYDHLYCGSRGFISSAAGSRRAQCRTIVRNAIRVSGHRRTCPSRYMKIFVHTRQHSRRSWDNSRCRRRWRRIKFWSMCARPIEAILYGVDPFDRILMGQALILITLISAAVTLIPSLRAGTS